eukprot:TRINITY_DN541_c0_g1_i1.p2 TRINITY_DN541_c0_g1~~TRINITY_DN541_c0_g1_i1.p2  ORF type:complete len:676 (-),score=85.29 TRINITY_DN541_c0_g1_i1:1184-3211(-)
MRDEIISLLKTKYREYSNISIQLLTRLVTEILAQMAGGVVRAHYKKTELTQGTPSENSEEENGEAALLKVESPNFINKSMPIYKPVEEPDGESIEVEKKRKIEEIKETKEFKQIIEEAGEEVSSDRGKMKKKKKTEETKGHSIESTISFKDLGGIDDIIADIRETIEWPLKYIKVYNHLGIQPPRGVLLCGPPGCGKTTLAMAICGEFNVPFFKISGPEIVSGMSGESEQKIRQLFKEVTDAAPAILFIDEIDSIAGKRDAAFKDMEKRIVAQFLTCIDDLNTTIDAEKPVVIIGATNRPEHLDAALRRAGRFDREITIGVPNEKAREQIIRKLCIKLRLSKECDFAEIARMTPGYVGADLVSLVKEAAIAAVKRILISVQNKSSDMLELTEEQMSAIYVEKKDFQLAQKKVQPSAMREGFTTIPDVTWDNVGALAAIREELEMSIVEPIKHPEVFARVGLTAPAGVLLYGPPGCGKTLVAKAVSNESKANFISIKGPELLNKYVGESEKAIRQLFHRARMSSPCIIFFDELDALCPKRGSEANSVTERVVNQLLTELDGLEERRNVFVIAATNRPDIIDSAMLRPGRLDKLLYVPLPNKEDRYSILQTQCKGKPVASDVNLKAIAEDPCCNVNFYKGIKKTLGIFRSGLSGLAPRSVNFGNKATLRRQGTRNRY